MQYRIESAIGDEESRGLRKDPGYEVEVEYAIDLNNHLSVGEELTNDDGHPLPIGASLTITRIA